jgi:hypothetical protein
MRPLVVLAALVSVLPACRRDAPETGTADTLLSSAADSTSPSKTPLRPPQSDTAVGVEAQAPRLIPAMRAQLQQLQSGGTGNLESYRGMVGQLIDAMESDLTRAQRIDSGGFKLLADSVLRDLGGGAGNPKPDEDNARRSVPEVKRLIDLYQSRMGQARAEP